MEFEDIPEEYKANPHNSGVIAEKIVNICDGVEAEGIDPNDILTGIALAHDVIHTEKGYSEMTTLGVPVTRKAIEHHKNASEEDQ